MGIVNEILQDGESGAKHLFDEYGGRLTAAALALCGNEADAKDLVSETVDIAVRQIGSYRNEAVFFEWLCGIMKNLYRHSRRRMSATNELPVADLPEMSVEGPVDGAAQIVQAVDAGILRDAVNALPHDMREAVVLRYFMDMPLAQIAKFLSLPVGTVKSRLHYARFALSTRLGEQLRKPAVAMIALGLFLAASAAAVAVVAVRGGGEAGAPETPETAGAAGATETTGTTGVTEAIGTTGTTETDAAFSSASDASAVSDCHLQSLNNQGETAMNIKAKAATVLAAATLATAPAARAKTVAWYHFNEGANGETAAGGQSVIINAADETSLSGKPYGITGTLKKSDSTYLPVYTNDMPSCVSWFDPVTGARGTDNRSLYLKTSNQYSTYPASAILVDDDETLHCQHITAEMMIKASPEAASKYAYGDWLHALTMLSTTSNAKAWGIMIRGSGQIICTINNSDNLFNGSSTSGDAGGGGAAGYSYSAVVSGSVPKITDGKWHHVAMTYDGTTVRLYVDYVLRGYLDWSGPLVYGANGSGMLCIGANYASSYGGWDGFIDEVRISDEALPPEKFLQVGGLANNASDQDTAIYLPLNSLEFSTDKFFGTVGQPIFHNSACSTNASLINMKLSTIAAGIFPRLDTGASAVVSNELHSGIFTTGAIANEGCWTYTNNLAYSGKARNIQIDDYSKNNGDHLISSGNFTAEFFLKVPETPTRSARILCENSGASGAGTIQLYVNGSYLYCTLYSQEQFDKYVSGEISSMTAADSYVPIGDIVGDKWHHVALVIDRTNQMAMFYLDGRLIRRHVNFVLASSVSTYSDAYKTLKIGDGYSGNSEGAAQNLSLDEFRITRRALAPQEFLMAGAAVDSAALEPTRAWIGFEGDLSVAPSEGAIPAGSSTASTVEMKYSLNVPGLPGGPLLDGNGNVLRESNMYSMCFSGAYGSGDTSADTASQRLFFERNILLEKDMKSMTVEFFMKGTKNEAKAWATILRMYGNATGADSSPFRRLWSVGYENAAGSIYVIKDINGGTQGTFYPDNHNVKLADGKWHHVAVTFEPDGTGKTLCKFYKDYQQIDSHTFNGELECGDYGTSSFAVGSRYNGFLDEIRISKGVLTVGQMMHVRKCGMVITIR